MIAKVQQLILWQSGDRTHLNRLQIGLWGWIQLLAMVAVMLAQGCASVPERNPVPEDFSVPAEVPGIPNARFWGDQPPPYMDQWLALSRSELQTLYPGIFGREHDYLAISGGGANGAFGASLLIGWSEAGNRPEFTVVTGISTGGLTAPFAFLGPAYDAQLKEVYTTYSTKDLFKARNKLAAAYGDAMASTEPLQAVIAKYVNEDMLQAIAAERRKGRRLLIGTINLDAMRPVIWNITRRTVDSLIRTQGIGDMHRMYIGAQRDGLDYHLAYIPREFDVKPNEPFDPEYMGKLFDLGYRMAKAGYPWRNTPPEFDEQ